MPGAATAATAKPTEQEQLLVKKKAEPGLWRKSMTAGEQGVYRISSGKLASVVTVGNANARELAAVTATGVGVLVVEQDVNQSMKVADRVQCLL